MEYATGEYIGFVDSDDYVDITMFEKLYQTHQENDVNFVYKGFGRLRNDSFWGSMQFRAANNYLKSKGKNPIDWR